MARTAGADGERALSDRDLPAAAGAFTAALDHLGDPAGADEESTDLAAAGHLGLGRVCLARNDIRGADLRFDQVQRLRPTWPEGFYWAGCAAAHQAGYERAEWLLSAALDRDDRHGKAYLQRGYVRLRRRKPEPALSDLLAAADRDATDDNARLLTAALLLRRGDAEQAAAVAAGIPDGAAVAAVLGMIRFRQGRTEDAAADLARAIAAGCADDAVLLHHGLAAFHRADPAASLASWRRLRDSHPHHDTLETLVATAQHARAAEALANDDVAAAIDHLPAAGPAPIIELAHLHGARRAIERGDWEPARTRLRAGGWRGMRYLAVLEFRAGRHAAAERLWRQALPMAPADPLVRFGLAVGAVRDGEPAEAELHDLCTDPATPQGIRRAAGRTLVALRLRDGDLSAATDSLGDADPGGREHPQLRCANGLAAARRGDWAAAAAGLPDRTEDLTGDLALVKAVACALSDRRADAAAHLARAAVRTPADHRLGHAEAVLRLHTLGAAEQPDDTGWRACIGAWLSLLHDKGFWTRWRDRAQRRYGGPVSVEMVQQARTAVDELLEQRLPTDDLALLLRRERAAAALLARLGGLPNPDPAGPPLVCGPLRIAELGLHRQLGEYLRARPADGNTVALFRQFSEIGVAEAQLAAGRPRAAARAALDLRCPSCARTGGRTHPAMISEPLLCEPACTEFDKRNPAFCTFADKHDELATASAELAAETLLGLARSDITKAETDLADARTCWRGAITLSQRFSHRDAVLREAVDDALGRARVLADRADLTGAIAVLDAVLVAVPTKDTAERERVTTELSLLLGARGVGAFNDTENAEQAHADLQRAVTLSPQLPRPRFNLGILLREMSYQSCRNFDLAAGIRLLGRSVEEFETGFALHDTDKFRDELEKTRDELALLLDEYRKQAPETEA